MEEEKPLAPKSGNSAGGVNRKSVMLDLATHQQLERAASKFKLSNSEYASTVIRYFAQNELDPTIEPPRSLAQLGLLLSAKTVDAQNTAAQVGNQLVRILRLWERQLYEYIQAQQTALIDYLGRMEANLLAQQVQVNNRVFSPLMEHVIRTEIESYATRVLVERTYLQVTEQPANRWENLNKLTSQERDQKVIATLQELLANNSAVEPKLTAKPAPMESPVARRAAGKNEGQPTKS